MSLFEDITIFRDKFKLTCQNYFSIYDSLDSNGNCDPSSTHKFHIYDNIAPLPIPLYSITEGTTNSSYSPKQAEFPPIGEPKERTKNISLKILNDDVQDVHDGNTVRSSTILDDDLVFKSIAKTNFVHNYTFSIISSETDIKLKKWCKLGIDSDELSPDMFFSIGDRDFWVEFTTNYGGDSASMENDVRHKFYKYSNALHERINKINSNIKPEENSRQVFLLVICVGKNRVVSNFDLGEITDDLVRELCCRYAFSIDVEQTLIQAGHILSSSKEDDILRVSIIKRAFTEIKFKDENKLSDLSKNCLTEKMLHKFCNLSLSDEDLTELIKEIQTDAYNSYKEKSDAFISDIKASIDTSKHNIYPSGKLLEARSKETNAQIEEYINNLIQNSTEENTRSNLKSVSHIPFINLLNNELSFNENVIDYRDILLDMPKFNITDEESGSVWTEVITAVETGCYHLSAESPASQLERALDPKDKNDNVLRNQWHRVKVDLTHETLDNLARKGLWKKENDNYLVEEYSEWTKKAIHWETPTDDIDDIIRNPEKFFKLSNRNHRVTEEVLGIINDSLSLHGDGKDHRFLTETVRAIMQTRIMNYCKLVSDIGTELAISLSQHVGYEQFVVKKLKDYDLWMIIRPTNSSGPCSYSLAWNTQHELFSCDNTAFAPALRAEGKWKYTEFRSVNHHKLNNWIACESMALNLIMFWMNEYKIDWISSISKPNANKTISHIRDLFEKPTKDMVDCQSMIMFSLLCLLEDKKQTEAILTNTRYVYMEGFVSFPYLPNPNKMLVKLPKMYRSRLAIFAAKKQLNLMKYINEGNYFLPEISIINNVKVKSRKNLINYITGSPTRNLNLIINLMYIGYLNNKNETMQGNKINSLYKKILEMEELFTEDVKKDIGKDIPKKLSELKVHEYSYKVLNMACMTAKNDLMKFHGRNVKSRIEQDILTRLSNVNIVDVFGTMKSSSTFDSENPQVINIGGLWDFANLTPEAKKELKEFLKPTRSKAILEISQLLKKCDSCENIAELMVYCHDVLMVLDRLDIDLFDKAQHASIREIFILNIHTRVCQYIIELIARVISEYFPNEAMTHPKEKDNITAIHANATKNAIGSSPYIQVSTSDDAKKWNQTHFVGKFGQMLCYFTPTYMWPFISNILDLWFKRNIKIDSRLMVIMEKTENMVTDDEEFLKLWRMYKTGDTCSWYKGDKANYISIKSGFMQGILHYTSSLYHCMSASLTKKISEDLIRTLLEEQDMNTGAFAYTNILSSDDSSVTISIQYSDKEHMLHSLCVTALCFEIKTVVGNSLGILLSEKSTCQTPFIMEFNSVFNYSESRFQAYIKHVIACLTVSEKEGLVSRQEEMSNSITAIIENGGSTLLAATCQISQALLFYRLLGSSSLIITASSLIPSLKELRDPSMGYFLMDSVVMSGMTGFKYNLWNLIKKDKKISKLMKYLLDNTMEKEVTESIKSKKHTLHTTTTGILTNSLIIPYGENRKLLKAQELMDVDESVLEEVNRDPIILYEKPRSQESILILLKLKLLSPGVTESFTRNIGLCFRAAQSVYLAINKLMLETANYYTCATQINSTKTSLTKRLLDSIDLISNNDKLNTLSQEEESLLFPFRLEYQHIKNQSDFLRLKNAVKKIRREANVKTRIQITEEESYLIPPVQLAASIWFQKPSKYSHRVIHSLWENLKKSIKWLDDNVYKTLEDSPFNNQHQLYNFLSRLEMKNRFVNILSAPTGHESASARLLTVLKRNVWPGLEIYIKSDGISDYNVLQNDYRSLRHGLTAICAVPFNKTTKAKEIISLIKGMPQITINPSFNSTRKNALYIIQKFIKRFGSSVKLKQDIVFKEDNSAKDDESKDIIQLLTEIYSLKLGILGSWVQRQKFSREGENGVCRYTGEGIWSGVFEDITCKILVDSNPDMEDSKTFVKKIYVNSNKLTVSFFNCFKQFCKDNNVLNIDPEVYDLTKDEKDDRICNCLNMTTSKNGCPIILKRDISAGLSPNSTLKIQLTKYDCIQLVADTSVYEEQIVEKKTKKGIPYMKKEGRFVSVTTTIISYKPNKKDYDLRTQINNLNKMTLTSFTKSWIEGKSLSVEGAQVLLMSCMKESEEVLTFFEPIGLKEFFIQLVEKELNSRGIRKNKKTEEAPVSALPAEQPEFKSSGIVITMLADLKFASVMDFCEEIYELENKTEYEDLDNYIVDNADITETLHMFADDFDKIEILKLGVMSNMFKVFIDHVTSIMSLKDLESFFHKRIFVRSSENIELLPILLFIGEFEESQVFIKDKPKLNKNLDQHSIMETLFGSDKSEE